MNSAVSITHNGHRTWLKWHRASKRSGDPVFTGARIVEGMRLGASIEVDLVVHRDRGYAVLHDLTVDRETTGTGAVVGLGAEQLRRLYLRANDGTPLDQHVMLLEDIADLLGAGEIHPEALLQLDYKEDARALDAAALASFRASVAPVARHMILSSGDAAAVAMLSRDVPGLRIGYDPCHDGALERLRQTRDFTGFVADAVTASPAAEMIYLHHQLVLDAADLEFDIVAAFHAENRRIDAYTISQANAATVPSIMRLLELKVDQITTDDAEGVSALVAGA